MRYSHSRVAKMATFVALVVAGCARGPAGGTADDFNVIAAAELQQHPEENLYTLVRRLRPTWLQTRPPVSAQSANLVVVVLDGVPQEPGLEPLRGLKVADVSEVRRLSANDATTRFGTGMTAGAILVATKRGR